MPGPGLSASPAADWTTEDAWIGTRRPILEAHALPADAYASEAFFAQAAMPALILILISSIPMAFLMLRGEESRS